MKKFFVQMRQVAFTALERRLGAYFTIHLRPIRSSKCNRGSFPTPALPSYAIIVQGPIVNKNDFTIETIRIYTKLFPDAPLIVSTWHDAPKEAVAALQTIPNVHVVLSEQPGFNGYGNSNYQIASTMAGIAKAEELGAEYVFKTRTDQRMYATDVYPFLHSLTEAFPLTNLGTQHKRIVALGYSTIKYRPYSLNDMFFFGTTHDLKLYWDLPYDMRNIPKARTIGEWQQSKVCEAYFLTSFLQKIGYPIKDTLEDFWDVLGSYFILIDPTDIDWYWFKYARYQEYHYRNYDKVVVGEEVSFKEWLMLQQGLGKLWPKPIGLENLPNDTHTTRVHFS